ncbi:MAG TPA: diguanylate cyclase [Candidatus Sulfotelmatobacter sp.]|nr:diguanylate cyclase [Candidatus Sulfotelmatobacter sp.]
MPRILVVGEAIIESAPIRHLLESKGYQLVRGCRLRDAVASILEDPPDLLIVEKGFDHGREIELINAAQACLHKANIPIFLVAPQEELAGLDWELYRVDDIVTPPLHPKELLARIGLAEARIQRVFDNNPLSRLPGNTSILRAIQKIITGRQAFAVCYLDIDNFKPFNDRYGFCRGDEVILTIARITVNVIQEMARQDSFAGHVGGDDFVFIVREEHAARVCEKIIANFEAVKTMFLTAEDAKAGGFHSTNRQGQKMVFPLPSISIAVVLTGEQQFEHPGQVALVASQLKSYVKKLDGSNYLIDRRESQLANLPQ